MLGLNLATLSLSGGSSRWTPAFLSSTAAWYPPEDISTLYTDQTFATNITAPGDPVGGAEDKGGANDLTQSTASYRPTYARHPANGVRQLLDDSDDLTGSAWAAFNCTVTDLGSGEFSLAFANATVGDARQTVAGVSTGDAVTVRLEVSKVDVDDFDLYIVGNASAESRIRYAFSTDSWSSTGSRITSYTSTDLGGGWVKLVVKGTAGAVQRFKVTASGLASGVETVKVRNIQVERGSTANALQTRVDKHDVTESGQASNYGLTGDGVDDLVSGSLDLSGTSAVTICMGVRKDAAGVILNHNQTTAPYLKLEATAAGYTITTDTDSATVASGYDTPSTDVVTVIIQPASVVLRVNGTQVATGSGTQANAFASATLSLLAMNDGTSPLDGVVYGCTICDAALSASDIASLETYVSSNTPEVSL